MTITLTQTLEFNEVHEHWEMFKQIVHRHFDYIDNLEMIVKYKESNAPELTQVVCIIETSSADGYAETRRAVETYLSDFYDNKNFIMFDE
jgi:hypothetical protein